MTNLNSIPKNILIHYISALSDHSERIRRTLGHVYPGVKIEKFSSTSDLPNEKPHIYIIDTTSKDTTELRGQIDSLGNRPVILLVESFGDIKIYSKYLSGKVSIVCASDLDSMGLIQAAHHLLERQILQEKLKKASVSLKELSLKDELTGLYNNRHFHDILSQEIKKANRYKRPLGLVMLSIKNFSHLNKTVGHKQADLLLKESANVLRQQIRDVDVCARFGDNEFSIILPESDEEAAKTVVSRIVEALKKVEVHGDGQKTNAEVSSGIASLSQKIKTKDDLLRIAIGTLSAAKKSGHGTIFTSKELDEKKKFVREDRRLIDRLNEKLTKITKESQKNYFTLIMRTLSEVPLLKKTLLPHSERVAFFARRLAEAAGLDESSSRAIYRAGILHDTGKLAIDTDIILKPGSLNLAEQELMQRHPVFGIQMIGQSPFFNEEIEAMLYHHERFDGEGYPERLSGNSIPVSARILGIAEAWDVMTTPQPYRMEPLSLDVAISEIVKAKGSQFDPDLVDRFTNLIAG